MTLNIGKEAMEEIRAHGRDAYPEECCGVLIGRETAGSGGPQVDVTAVRRMANTKEGERGRRYIIDPLVLMRLEDELDVSDERIVGIYHSHPDHPARPSEFDRAHALPGWSYIVLRVAAGKDEAMTSWRLRDDRSLFDEETLQTTSRPHDPPI